MNPTILNDALILGKDEHGFEAKVYLEPGETIEAIERSWVSVKGHPDPLFVIVTETTSGEVRAWWTSKSQALQHPTRRFSMLRFPGVKEALCHAKYNAPGVWCGDQAPETYTVKVEAGE